MMVLTIVTMMTMQRNAAKQHKESMKRCWEQYHGDDRVDVDDDHHLVHVVNDVYDDGGDDVAKKRCETA